MINDAVFGCLSPGCWGGRCPLPGGQVQLPRRLKVIGDPAFSIRLEHDFIFFLVQPNEQHE